MLGFQQSIYLYCGLFDQKMPLGLHLYDCKPNELLIKSTVTLHTSVSLRNMYLRRKYECSYFFSCLYCHILVRTAESVRLENS